MILRLFFLACSAEGTGYTALPVKQNVMHKNKHKTQNPLLKVEEKGIALLININLYSYLVN